MYEHQEKKRSRTPVPMPQGKEKKKKRKPCEITTQRIKLQQTRGRENLSIHLGEKTMTAGLVGDYTSLVRPGPSERTTLRHATLQDHI